MPQLLAETRTAIGHIRFYRVCADSAIGDPVPVTAERRAEYARIADEHMQRAMALMEEAVGRVRNSSKRDLARWLTHKDARLRQFVIEWMGKRP